MLPPWIEDRFNDKWGSLNDARSLRVLKFEALINERRDALLDELRGRLLKDAA